MTTMKKQVNDQGTRFLAFIATTTTNIGTITRMRRNIICSKQNIMERIPRICARLRIKMLLMIMMVETNREITGIWVG